MTEHLYVFPVLVGHYSRDCGPEQLDQERRYLIDLPCTTNSFAGRDISTTTTVCDLHTHAEMTSATEFVYSCVQQYCEELGTHTELAISASWFNTVLPGGTVLKHRHKNSVISGVMYYDSTEDSPLVLINPNSEHTDLELDIQPDRYNLRNARDIIMPATAGTVILFPSNLQHLVTHNPADTARAVFAFNLFPAAAQTLGTPGRSNHLRL